MDRLAEKYDLRKAGLFYLDIYPIKGVTTLVVVDADVAAQVTQGKTTWHKHPAMGEEFGRAIGPRGLVLQEDEEWKELRTMFNPGFSAANLMSMVPMLVEEGEIFTSRLSKLAAVDGGFVRSMDSVAAALTVDIIGQALLGVKFHTQTTPRGTLVSSIIETSRLVKTLTNISLERFNLWRLAKVRYYDYLANSELSSVLLKKWEELVAAPEAAQKSNVIFDIAMDKYMRRGGKLEGEISKDFLEVMRDNVKTFIFAGHDTTSATITWALYTLSKYPECLAELRKEHDEVLGLDPDEAGKRLIADPHLANSLPYTTAVLREIMRIFSPASSARQAPPGSFITGRDGKPYSTDDVLIWISSFVIMNDPAHFPEPHRFMPERFLPERSPFPAIAKNAYRPFEKGARDCVGQELAMLEGRVILALTVRRFDFREAYDHLDGLLGRAPPPVYAGCADYGERAYQVLLTAAKPKDGLPMWVRERPKGNV
ncbi:hypothetical protein PVAG01_05959 [Phlyctema vagabunda]|uniref:Cytochrome P450 n=1 Tax=Phlyctema vagabunda TaxID=108571 RepID=A0ABR4PEQ4_9HELO